MLSRAAHALCCAPAESTVDNTQNTAASSEQFFSPSSYQSGAPQEETVPVPSLKDLLDEDATATIGLNSTLGFDENDETKPVGSEPPASTSVARRQQTLRLSAQ